MTLPLLLLCARLCAATAPAATALDVPLYAVYQELLAGQPLTPELQQLLQALPAATRQPQFRPDIPELFEAATRNFPATPRGRCLRSALAIRCAIAWRAPKLYRSSYYEGHELCLQLPAIPATERLLLLNAHFRQCKTEAESPALSRDQYHQESWRNCRRLSLQAAGDCLSSCPAQANAAELALRANLLEEWWRNTNHTKLLTDPEWDQLRRLPCPNPWLQAYGRALLLLPVCHCSPLHPATERPAALRQARQDLQAASAAAPTPFLQQLMLLRLDSHLARRLDELQPAAEQLLRLAPVSVDAHRHWSAACGPSLLGNAQELKNRIEPLARDPAAFSAEGYPLCLIYLNQLISAEGPAVNQESWVQQARSACRARLEQRAAAGLPCDQLSRRRSQLIGPLLDDDETCRRQCAGCDLLRDFDYSVLRPAIASPLDLARSFAKKLQPALVKEVDARLDWQRGRPAEQPLDTAGLSALEARLQGAAQDADPHARNWFLAWSRTCKLNRDFLAGAWVELRYDDPWLWRCSVGDTRVDAPESLLAATMGGERFLLQHASCFPPPFQACLSVIPHHIHDEVHGAPHCYFGVACGDFAQLPLTGRIFATDTVSHGAAFASRQALTWADEVNFTRQARGEGPTLTEVMIYPDSGDLLSSTRDAQGKPATMGHTCMSNDLSEKAEGIFLPGQLGIASPTTMNGLVHLGTLKVRRLQLPSPEQPEFWEKRFDLCCTEYTSLRYTESLIRRHQLEELRQRLADTERIEKLGSYLFGKDQNFHEPNSYAPLARRLLCQAYTLLGRPHDAAGMARRLADTSPADDGDELARNHMEWARLAALDPQATPEELRQAQDAVDLILLKIPPRQRCLARRAQASLLARQGDVAAARRSLAIARALGKDLAEYRELLQEKEPWE